MFIQKTSLVSVTGTFLSLNVRVCHWDLLFGGLRQSHVANASLNQVWVEANTRGGKDFTDPCLLVLAAEIVDRRVVEAAVFAPTASRAIPVELTAGSLIPRHLASFPLRKDGLARQVTSDDDFAGVLSPLLSPAVASAFASAFALGFLLLALFPTLLARRISREASESGFDLGAEVGLERIALAGFEGGIAVSLRPRCGLLR